MGEDEVKSIMKSNEHTDKLYQKVYIKKWTKNKHAILFKLTNGAVQCNFYDLTEILLSKKHNLCVYYDKIGLKYECDLEAAMLTDNLEMLNRLNFMKKMLHHLSK